MSHQWGIVQWQDSGFWFQLSRFESLYPSHFRRYRLGVRTSGSQPLNRGSSPRSATKGCIFEYNSGVLPFLIVLNDFYQIQISKIKLNLQINLTFSPIKECVLLHFNSTISIQVHSSDSNNCIRFSYCTKPNLLYNS